MILNKKPIKIELYDCGAVDRQIGGEVTSPFIKETSSTRFHPDGLFSEIIFGEIGSSQRLTQFGFIDLQTTVFNPMVFQDMVRSKKLYNDIMAGNVFVVFDDSIKDFVQCKPEEYGADTGFSFFVKHFFKLKFFDKSLATSTTDEIKSRTVKDKVLLMQKFPGRLLIDKWLVLPAELREYRIEDGRGVSDEINNLYLSLLNLCRLDKDRSNKESSLYDGLRYKIQLKVLEIAEYIKDILKDDGYLEKKYGSRSVAWGTRNIISPLQMNNRKLEDSTNIQCDETGLPLFQAIKCFQPLVINKLMSIFFTPIMDVDSSQMSAINKKTLNLEYIEITEKEKSKFITIDGVSDTINRFKNREYRKNHMVVYNTEGLQYYLYLIYDDGSNIYLTRSKSDLERYYFEQNKKHIDLNKLRPLTLNEMFFIATYLTTIDKYTLITRYPVTWVDSMYPSKVKLMSTTKSRTVIFRSLFNDMTIPIVNYPILKYDNIDSLKLYPARLKALGADHDGDAINVTGVMSDESCEEIRTHINSIQYYINQNKKLNLAGSTYLIDLTSYNFSYVDPKHGI